MIFILTILLLLLLITITTSTITTSTITRNGENVAIRILEESKSTPDQRVCVRINDYVDISFVVYYKDSDDVKIEIDRNNNFRFHVGSSSKSVIEGLDIGIIGTCINEIRQIEIPPSLGYSRHDKIPIGSTLIFNIYCNDINNIKKNAVVKPVDDFFTSLDTNSNGSIEIDEFVKGMDRSNIIDIDEHIVMLNFQRADTNADGSITNIEFKRAANLIKLANEVHAAKQSKMTKDL